MKQIRKVFKSIYFTRKFPFMKIRSSSRASLVLVKDSWTDCKNEAELTLYKLLRSRDYYPTPHYSINGMRVNVALIPYRLALIERHDKIDEKKISRILRKNKWHVLFYEAEKLVNDAQPYIQIVQQHTKNARKNISM